MFVITVVRIIIMCANNMTDLNQRTCSERVGQLIGDGRFSVCSYLQAVFSILSF